VFRRSSTGLGRFLSGSPLWACSAVPLPQG
jgi:hypothetical protein